MSEEVKDSDEMRVSTVTGPYLGQPVIYNLSGTELPAIITRVWTDTCVNLVVFVDQTSFRGSAPVMPVTSALKGNGLGTWRYV